MANSQPKHRKEQRQGTEREPLPVPTPTAQLWEEACAAGSMKMSLMTVLKVSVISTLRSEVLAWISYDSSVCREMIIFSFKEE